MRLGVPIIAAAALLAVPTAAQASPIDLANAPGTIRVDGARGDQLGEAVANAGDVNGDGRPDVIVGVPNVDPAPVGTDAGAAFVLYGGHGLATVDLKHLGPAGFRIDGAAPGDRAGTSVARAGDVNGDGVSDVLVGAPGANTAAGSAYVIYGERTVDPANVALANLATTQAARGMRIDGAAAGDQAGDSVAGGPDLNGDGRSDVVVGAPDASNNGRSESGSAYVVYGQGTDDPADLNLAEIETTEAARAMRIDGAATDDIAGLAVAAGDLNDDGIADAIVSAPFAANNSRQESGSVYVVYGEKGDDPTDVDLATLNTTQAARGMRIDGPTPLAGELGVAVAGGRDLNGDRIGDLIIGAPDASIGRRFGGVAYVVYGQRGDAPDLDLADIATTEAARGFSIRGAEGGDDAGLAVSVGNDVNGDGRPDAIVGADTAGNNRRLFSGSAYVIFGQRSADPSNIDLAKVTTTQASRGLRIDGAVRGDRAGSTVAASVGDLDGDGLADVIVGAPGAHHPRQGSGSAYVVGVGPGPPPAGAPGARR